MILYNMRYRGPLEYDKFVLNILQFHNEVIDLLEKEFSEDSSNSKKLNDLQEQINSIYYSLTSSEGISENLYLKLLEYKEC